MGETVAEKKRGRPGKAEPVVAKKAKTVVAPVEESEEEASEQEEEAPAAPALAKRAKNAKTVVAPAEESEEEEEEAAAPAKRGRGRPPKDGIVRPKIPKKKAFGAGRGKGWHLKKGAVLEKKSNE